MRHLTAHEITAQDYAWPLLHTMFSEVFPRHDWMILFDHVFFNHPSFLLYCVAAYVTTGISYTRYAFFAFFLEKSEKVSLKISIPSLCSIRNFTETLFQLEDRYCPYRCVAIFSFSFITETPSWRRR